MSAQSICPVRGLAGLEAPEPETLGKGAGTAGDLGLDDLVIPVLEESLSRGAKTRIRFLDNLIRALDAMDDAGLPARLVVPARNVLGLDWVPPYLVSTAGRAKSQTVFVEGKIRELKTFQWWSDLSIVQKRIRLFGDVTAALAGHPAICGWILFDRALEWPRPSRRAADAVLRSYIAQIRERDEAVRIDMGLGWAELLDPGMARGLVPLVDGIRMGGLDQALMPLQKPKTLAEDILLAAYLGALSRWLFESIPEVEIGWGCLGDMGDMEDIAESAGRFAAVGLNKAFWPNLVDPLPELHPAPPWNQRPGLTRIGLLDHHLEPKGPVLDFLDGFLSTTGSDVEAWDDFIDIAAEEFMSDPATHLTRLWNRFLD